LRRCPRRCVGVTRQRRWDVCRTRGLPAWRRCGIGRARGPERRRQARPGGRVPRLRHVGAARPWRRHLRRSGVLRYESGTDDGKVDLVTTNSSSNTVSVLLGHGDGTFAPKVDYVTGLSPVSVAIGNLNGDSKPDLVVANPSSNAVSVLLGHGDGTFASKVDFA